MLRGFLVGAMLAFQPPALHISSQENPKDYLGRGRTRMMSSSCAPFFLIRPLIGAVLREQNAVGLWAGLNFPMGSVFRFRALRAAGVVDKIGCVMKNRYLEELPGKNQDSIACRGLEACENEYIGNVLGFQPSLLELIYSSFLEDGNFPASAFA